MSHKRDIELMSAKKLDEVQSAVYEECKKKVEQNAKDLDNVQEIYNSLIQQMGKTPPASDNS